MGELYTLPLFNDASLKAYYRFNNGALTTDSKGAFTLTVQGSPVGTSGGKFGYGADFGTSNPGDYLKCTANDLGIAGSSSITMGIWIFLRTQPATNTTKEIIKHNSTTSERYIRCLYGDVSGVKKLRIGLSNTITDFDYTLDTDRWHHLAVARDMANSVGYFYLDGIKVISNATIGTGAYGVNRFNIGGDEDGTFGGISAYLDDAAIFSKVLTDIEMQTLADSNFSKRIMFGMNQSVKRAAFF